VRHLFSPGPLGGGASAANGRGRRDAKASRLRLRAACAAVAVLLLLCLVVAACGSENGQTSPSPSSSGPVVLTVVGEDASRTFTMNQLEALPSYTGYAGIRSSTGVITPPKQYTGVKLTDLTGSWAASPRPTASRSWPGTATG
jgi:hypothetical protein